MIAVAFKERGSVLKMDIVEAGISMVGKKFEAVNKPEWKEIEKAIRLLSTATGQVGLRAVSDDIEIVGENGEYYAVCVVNMGCSILIDDSKAVIDQQARKLLPIYADECFGHNTIDDIDVVVKMVKSLLESGELIDDSPFVWLEQSEHPKRFAYPGQLT